MRVYISMSNAEIYWKDPLNNSLVKRLEDKYAEVIGTETKLIHECNNIEEVQTKYTNEVAKEAHERIRGGAIKILFDWVDNSQKQGVAGVGNILANFSIEDGSPYNGFYNISKELTKVRELEEDKTRLLDSGISGNSDDINNINNEIMRYAELI